MICSLHGKEIESSCQWCGKGLCKKCVIKSDGKKRYCSGCADVVGDMLKKKQLNRIKEESAAEKKSKTEYFNFSTLKPR